MSSLLAAEEGEGDNGVGMECGPQTGLPEASISLLGRGNSVLLYPGLVLRLLAGYTSVAATVTSPGRLTLEIIVGGVTKRLAGAVAAIDSAPGRRIG